MANDGSAGDDIDPSRQHLLSSRTNPPASLFSLPEDYGVDIPMSMTPSEFRKRLLLGTSQPEPSLPKPTQHRLNRSNSAPSMAAINDLTLTPRIYEEPEESVWEPIVRQVITLFIVYLSFGALIYWLNQSPDMADSVVTKLCSMLFVLVGFGFVDLLLSVMVGYLLDTQKSKKWYIRMDADIRGRIETMLKVGLALGVLLLCLGFGVLITHYVEEIGWLDSFYFSVVSVGYGDRGFKTLPGKLLASIWLLVSAVAIARVFLYLSQARVDKRNREWAKKVLHEDMSISQFLAADVDNNGYVSKAEYVIYKLKMMEKITDMDIIPIARQFERLDPINSGKITLLDR